MSHKIIQGEMPVGLYVSSFQFWLHDMQPHSGIAAAPLSKKSVWKWRGARSQALILQAGPCAAASTAARTCYSGMSWRNRQMISGHTPSAIHCLNLELHVQADHADHRGGPATNTIRLIVAFRFSSVTVQTLKLDVYIRRFGCR